ncbi:grpE protein [Physcia stellaris]|nr:grpE protein [Physcia stellaris]
MIQRCLLRQSLPKFRPFPVSAISPDCVLRNHPSLRVSNALRRQATASKYYSSATEATSNSESSTAERENTAQKEESPLKNELQNKDKEIIDLKDKYLRSVADFRNLQERTKRDIRNAREFAISQFAKDLLESIDNLDRALETVPADKIGKEDSNKDLMNLYDGLRMTETILMQTLKKHGLERFDPAEQEEKFNPNLHEATFQTKLEGKEDGTVFITQQKGFSLNGRVVRAAKVGVVKNS